MKKSVLILAHGAGAPMDSEWMNFVTKLFEKQIIVVRFEFPYMKKLREEKKKFAPPDKLEKLIDCFQNVIEKTMAEYPDHKIYIGGKSMGGKVATLIASENLNQYPIEGVFVFGYPFYSAKNKTTKKFTHLLACSSLTQNKTKILIFQGTKDALGSKEELTNNQVILRGRVQITWFEDSDHSLRPSKKSKFTLEENLTLTVAHCLEAI